MRNEKAKSVELPKDIVEGVEDRVAKTQFETVSEYISHTMAEILHEVETETDMDREDQVNEQEVRDRLESLGYLNE